MSHGEAIFTSEESPGRDRIQSGVGEILISPQCVLEHDINGLGARIDPRMDPPDPPLPKLPFVKAAVGP